MLSGQKVVKNFFIPLFIIILLTPLPTFAETRLHSISDRAADRFHVDRSLGRADMRAARFSNHEVIVKYANSDRAVRVATRGRGVSEVLDELNDESAVEYAEPNYLAHAFFEPNDAYYEPYQWNFDNNTNGGVHAEAAWDVTTGEGVVIAIIDTGVAYENYSRGFFEQYQKAPDLAGTHFVEGYDFVNNDTHPNDDQGHGTHVAGTIAGTTNNHDGVAGLAHGAAIMPIKVLDHNGAGTYADVADGIRFAADNGADVINLSLGGPVGASYLEDALEYAHSKGVTIVAASGNDGASSVSYPAAYDDYVIAVGATRFDEKIASYSNRGSSLDIVAPGGDTSVDQNGDGYGDGILQQTFSNSPTKFGYYFYQGTSMAAPHAAAAAALVIASGKATSPASVQALLESTADDLGTTGHDNTYGHGLLNLSTALGEINTPLFAEPEPETNPEESNQSPVADAGADQTFIDSDNNGSEKITLDGTSSTDTDGSIEQFEWFEGTTSLGTGAVLETNFDIGSHEIMLVITDNDGADSSDLITIIVEAGAHEPTPPKSTTLLSEGFENSLGNWTQDNQRDWKVSSRNSYTGGYSAEIDGRTTNGTILSPTLQAHGKNIRISFSWFIDDSLDQNEYLAFDISTDGGTTWTEYRRLRGNQDLEGTWLHNTVELNHASLLKLRFRGNISGATEDAYIDAILIETFS